MEENKLERLREIASLKNYRRAKHETDEQYARRLTGILHRGWAFFKGEGRREWFESEVNNTLALLPKLK
jgi:DNA-binding IclR family transcriptional regulator